MLKKEYAKFYVVKCGQTVEEIAEFFSVSPWLLVKENNLKEQPFTGQILSIPDETGDAYTVQAGDSKDLLCGSDENYALKNGTDVFYIGMKARIGTIKRDGE